MMNSYKTACAPSEDSDHPEHPCSPVGVFAERSEGNQGESVFKQTAKTLISLCGSRLICPGRAHMKSCREYCVPAQMVMITIDSQKYVI